MQNIGYNPFTPTNMEEYVSSPPGIYTSPPSDFEGEYPHPTAMPQNNLSFFSHTFHPGYNYPDPFSKQELQMFPAAPSPVASPHSHFDINNNHYESPPSQPSTPITTDMHGYMNSVPKQRIKLTSRSNQFIEMTSIPHQLVLVSGNKLKSMKPAFKFRLNPSINPDAIVGVHAQMLDPEQGRDCSHLLMGAKDRSSVKGHYEFASIKLNPGSHKRTKSEDGSDSPTKSRFNSSGTEKIGNQLFYIRFVVDMIDGGRISGPLIPIVPYTNVNQLAAATTLLLFQTESVLAYNELLDDLSHYKYWQPPGKRMNKRYLTRSELGALLDKIANMHHTIKKEDFRLFWEKFMDFERMVYLRETSSKEVNLWSKEYILCVTTDQATALLNQHKDKPNAFILRLCTSFFGIKPLAELSTMALTVWQNGQVKHMFISPNQSGKTLLEGIAKKDEFKYFVMADGRVCEKAEIMPPNLTKTGVAHYVIGQLD